MAKVVHFSVIKWVTFRLTNIFLNSNEIVKKETWEYIWVKVIFDNPRGERFQKTHNHSRCEISERNQSLFS
jgi:hypothetical protein